jgi:DNA helicase II / ATP-dependent DNA helicase PcrA
MNLSDEQKLILKDPFGYTQIIAAAGSGKTFTIIELVAYLILDKKIEESKILMITFSRKAAREMRERLKKRIGSHNVMIYTFHAYCLRVLKKFNPKFKEKIKIITPENKINFYKETFKKERFRIGGIPYSFLISKKNSCLTNLFPELDDSIKRDYLLYKEKHNFVDFDDLVSFYIEGLVRKEEWAMNAKNEFSTILVDEFQDTDPEQVRWLKLLNPENLIVVGDDWQAIYGFRGATTEPFLDFEKYFSPCKKLYLTTNYRSDIYIVKASAIPIQKNKKNIMKNVLPHSINTGIVKIINIESENDWRTYLPILLENSENKVLVRTNYRAKKLKKFGYPERQLCTIHSSKGLEYPTVFLDLTDGWSSEGIDSIDLEEERRVLYVGLSRAISALWIFGKQNGTKESLETIFFQYFTKY